jgi:hypothetical protein
LGSIYHLIYSAQTRAGKVLLLIADFLFNSFQARVISDVKQNCDLNKQVTAAGLQGLIDDFFNDWYEKWFLGIDGNSRGKHHRELSCLRHRLNLAIDTAIPPYVEILVTHGRLSIYSSVINHPTAPLEVTRFFRAAGLSSALNVMRAAVQGEGRLKSMPNNTGKNCFLLHKAFFAHSTSSHNDIICRNAEYPTEYNGRRHQSESCAKYPRPYQRDR